MWMMPLHLHVNQKSDYDDMIPVPIRNGGSYMSTHVLLNLLNKLWKRDKTRGLPSILSLFCKEFNKFNNTGAQMFRFYLSYDIK